MTVRELIESNSGNITEDPGHRPYFYLFCYEQLPASTAVVEANRLTEHAADMLDREVESWYCCFDQHDVDTVEFWVRVHAVIT